MSYNKDLAYIHDAGFTESARQAAATVLNLLREKKIKSGLVVDLGCGSGVLANRLTREGFDVLGVDISEAMLKLARKRPRDPTPRRRLVRRCEGFVRRRASDRAGPRPTWPAWEAPTIQRFRVSSTVR